MAERNRKRNSHTNANGRATDDEPIRGNDMSDMDDMDENDFAGVRAGNTVDPIDRVAQLYHFLRSPQVDTTIRRFVASRKTRQLITAGMSILEVVVVLLPLLKKLAGRVNDAATLVQSQQRPRSGTRGGTGRSRAGRSLPAHTTSGGSSVN